MKRKTILLTGLMMAAVLSACTDSTSQSGRGPYAEEEEPEATSAPTPTPTPTPEEPIIDPEPEPVYTEMEVTVDNITIKTGEHGTFEDREFPLAYVVYQQINLDDVSREQWTNLDRTLEKINNEVCEDAIETLEYNYEYACELDETIRYSSNLREANVYVLRADERMLSYYTSYYAMTNGPHPAIWYESRCINTTSGKELQISDIISGDRLAKLPNIIFDNLVADALGEDYEFSEEEESIIRSRLEEIVDEGTLVWGMDDKNLLIYFASETLMSYAFGPLSATICLDDYPGLVNEWYLPVDCSPVGGRVVYVDSEYVN